MPWKGVRTLAKARNTGSSSGRRRTSHALLAQVSSRAVTAQAGVPGARAHDLRSEGEARQRQRPHNAVHSNKHTKTARRQAHLMKEGREWSLREGKQCLHFLLPGEFPQQSTRRQIQCGPSYAESRAVTSPARPNELLSAGQTPREGRDARTNVARKALQGPPPPGSTVLFRAALGGNSPRSAEIFDRTKARTDSAPPPKRTD